MTRHTFTHSHTVFRGRERERRIQTQQRGAPAERPAVCNDKSTELKRSVRLWIAQLSGFYADAEFCRLCCDGGKILSLQKKKKNSKEISADTALCHITLNPLKSNTLSSLSEPSSPRERRQSEKEMPPSPPGGPEVNTYPNHPSGSESIRMDFSALSAFFRGSLGSTSSLS